MPALNYLAIVVAAVAAFVAASVWYVVFNRHRMELLRVTPEAAADMARPAPWKMVLEIVKGIVLASVLAGLAAQLGIADWAGALQLGFALWIGFPVVLLVGSVAWDNVPWKLAAIHAGDWLIKVLGISVIVGVWR